MLQIVSLVRVHISSLATCLVQKTPPAQVACEDHRSQVDYVCCVCMSLSVSASAQTLACTSWTPLGRYYKAILTSLIQACLLLSTVLPSSTHTLGYTSLGFDRWQLSLNAMFRPGLRLSPVLKSQANPRLVQSKMCVLCVFLATVSTIFKLALTFLKSTEE